MDTYHWQRREQKLNKQKRVMKMSGRDIGQLYAITINKNLKKFKKNKRQAKEGY
jgi:hypothetical protein